MKPCNFRVLWLLGLASVVACSEPPPPSVAPPPKAAAPKAVAAPAAPAEVLSYVYNPTGKRDPFRSPLIESNQMASESACGDPLCQWDLSQLTLVAVVTGDSHPIAMVEDPQGKGFIVRHNSRMGKQGGRVSNILRDSIVVTEYWQMPDTKERVANPVSLKLKSEPKELPSMDLLSGRMVE